MSSRGRYGLPVTPASHNPVAQGGRSGGLLLAPGTNQDVSFGNEKKRQRNIKRTRGIFRTNISPVARGPETPNTSGQKVEYVSSDPSVQAYLHLEDRDERRNAKRQRVLWAQTHEEVVFAARVNANRGHSALIRPAAPAQPNWKTSYIIGQRHVTPQGPYNSYQQKSVIQRIGDNLNKR